MANEDFVVSFGSNASALAGKLVKDLAPARAEIKLFRRGLTDGLASRSPNLVKD